MLNESDAVNRSTANGVTTVFPYTFKIYDKSEIEVLANETVLTLDLHYTVSGVGNDGGGNITTIPTYANGTIITRLRKQPTVQTSNYQSEAFPPERIERDFDKLAMRLQQVKEMLRRCFLMGRSSSTVDQYVDTPVVGSFARAKVGGGVDWATPAAVNASLPLAVSDGGTGVTTATGTGSVVKQDSPTINTPTITGLSLSAVASISMTGGVNGAISTVASSATPDIFAASVGNTVNYTGTTPATGFTAAPQAGAQRLLICAGAAPFVAGANMLIDGIASGSTFTAAAGDKMLVVAVTTTQFRLTPMKYDGTAVVNPLASLTSITNPIINGNMEIWQRGTTFAGAVTQYTADRWYFNETGGGAATVRRSTDVPSVGSAGMLFNYSLEVDVTTALADPTGFEGYLRYIMEGSNWRQFAQRIFTLSFWVKSSKTGVHSVKFSNLDSGVDTTYITSYTVNAADTWEYKSIVVPASASAGSWGYTSGVAGLYLKWYLYSSSTVNRAANTTAWATGDAGYRGVTDQVNLFDSTSNFFRITGVKMELGSTASPIQFVPFEQELARCQRYYQKSFNYATTPAQNVGSLTGEWVFPAGKAAAALNWSNSISLPTRLRSTSYTRTLYNPNAANGQVRDSTLGGDCSSSGTTTLGDGSFAISTTGNASTAVGNLLTVHWTADAEF